MNAWDVPVLAALVLWLGMFHVYPLLLPLLFPRAGRSYESLPRYQDWYWTAGRVPADSDLERSQRGWHLGKQLLVDFSQAPSCYVWLAIGSALVFGGLGGRTGVWIAAVMWAVFMVALARKGVPGIRHGKLAVLRVTSVEPPRIHRSSFVMAFRSGEPAAESKQILMRWRETRDLITSCGPIDVLVLEHGDVVGVAGMRPARLVVESAAEPGELPPNVPA